MPNLITFKSIGYLSSDLKQRYETPRQGVLAKGNKAVINLRTNIRHKKKIFAF